MNYKLKNRGFSLTEVLLSVGTLAVGMIFIAGVFPVGIHFTTIATERTIAAIAADEAFAKIKIYAKGDPSKNLPGDDDIDLSKLAVDKLRDFNDKDIFPAVKDANSNEFTYPSDPNINISRKQYCWSALCRRVGADPNSNSRLVQVTVFVCRKTSTGLRYPKDDLDVPEYDWPMPVIVGVEDAGAKDRLRIRKRSDASGDKRFINDGSTIVDNYSGQIYRVLERVATADDEIVLDRDWDDDTPDPDKVWVVPPPVGGGRYPCIAVYQKVIRF